MITAFGQCLGAPGTLSLYSAVGIQGMCLDFVNISEWDSQFSASVGVSNAAHKLSLSLKFIDIRAAMFWRTTCFLSNLSLFLYY